MREKDTHCSYGGHAFPSGALWPRTCEECGHTGYSSPCPVAVLLPPIDRGPLVVRRGVEPGKGVLSIPLNILAGGQSIQDLEDRRVDDAFMDMLVIARAPGAPPLRGGSAPWSTHAAPRHPNPAESALAAH